MKDDDKKMLGDQGEELGRSISQLLGCYVLKASMTGNGKAAMLEGKNEKLILPDNFFIEKENSKWVKIIKKGIFDCDLWLEQKTKTVASFSINEKKWQHGVVIRNWNHYMRVQKVSKRPGYIMLLEINPPYIFPKEIYKNEYKPKTYFMISSLDTLQLCKRQARNQGRMHYWLHRDKFDIFEINNKNKNLKIPNGLQPYASSTLEDIKSGKYKEIFEQTHKIINI